MEVEYKKENVSNDKKGTDITNKGKAIGTISDEMVEKATVQDVIDIVLEALLDLGPVILNRSNTTETIYIKFNDRRMGILRISEHGESDKSHQKWNLRKDIKKRYKRYKSASIGYYCPWQDIPEFMIFIQKHANKLGVKRVKV